MGSWNHVCMATRLPVVNGERVVSFFLTDEDASMGFSCYADGYWAPIPVAIYGHYNDYGAVDRFTGKFDDVLLEHLRRTCRLITEKEEGRNSNRLAGFELKDMTLEQLYEADHEATIVYQRRGFARNKSERALRHVVIKESFWDKVLREHRVSFHRNVPGTSHWERSILTFSDITADLSGQVDAVVAFIEEQEDSLDFITGHDNPFRSMTDAPPVTKWLGLVKSNYAGHNFPITDVFKRLSRSDFQEWILETAKFNWFVHYMSKAHLQWGPITNASQEIDPQSYEIMADYLSEEIERYRAELDDEEDDNAVTEPDI